jgi:YVTN family beta-propeller protein
MLVKGNRHPVIMVGLLIAILVVFPVSAAPVDYSLVTKIQLPGMGGHGDWVTYDPGTNKVYVALHESGVAVVDAASNAVAADVEPIKGPNGIAYDSSYLYAASGDSNELVVISKSSWKIVGRVKTKGGTPDGIWVDTTRGKLLVASDDNNWVEVYSLGASPSLMRTISLLPAKPESGPDVGLLVPSKGYLYMPDDALVQIVNLDTMLVGLYVDTKIPLTKFGGTKNMAYDPKTNHLWVGTTNKKVLVLDADTLESVGSAPAHGGIDEVVFDPGLRLVYTFESSAKGFDAFNADDMTPVAYVNTGSGNTHTGDVDPSSHRVFVYEGDANILAVYAPAMK